MLVLFCIVVQATLKYVKRPHHIPTHFLEKSLQWAHFLDKRPRPSSSSSSIVNQQLLLIDDEQAQVAIHEIEQRTVFADSSLQQGAARTAS